MGKEDDNTRNCPSVLKEGKRTDMQAIVGWGPDSHKQVHMFLALQSPFRIQSCMPVLLASLFAPAIPAKQNVGEEYHIKKHTPWISATVYLYLNVYCLQLN